MAGNPASGSVDCAPVEPEVDDDGVDDEAVEVQKPRVMQVARQPTAEEIEHHVASGHAQHRTWCDAA